MNNPVTERQVIDDDKELMFELVDAVDKQYPNKPDDVRMTCAISLFINLTKALYFHRQKGGK